MRQLTVGQDPRHVPSLLSAAALCLRRPLRPVRPLHPTEFAGRTVFGEGGRRDAVLAATAAEQNCTREQGARSGPLLSGAGLQVRFPVGGSLLGAAPATTIRQGGRRGVSPCRAAAPSASRRRAWLGQDHHRARDHVTLVQHHGGRILPGRHRRRRGSSGAALAARAAGASRWCSRTRTPAVELRASAPATRCARRSALTECRRGAARGRCSRSPGPGLRAPSQRRVLFPHQFSTAASASASC